LTAQNTPAIDRTEKNGPGTHRKKKKGRENLAGGNQTTARRGEPGLKIVFGVLRRRATAVVRNEQPIRIEPSKFTKNQASGQMKRYGAAYKKGGGGGKARKKKEKKKKKKKERERKKGEKKKKKKGRERKRTRKKREKKEEKKRKGKREKEKKKEKKNQGKKRKIRKMIPMERTFPVGPERPCGKKRWLSNRAKSGRVY